MRLGVDVSTLQSTELKQIGVNDAVTNSITKAIQSKRSCCDGMSLMLGSLMLTASISSATKIANVSL